MNMKKVMISVVGLGRLGLPLALCFATKGYHVYGVDVSKSTVNKLNNGSFQSKEKSVEKLLKQNIKRIVFSTFYQEAINNTSITYIVVPTPSTNKGDFSNEYIKKVLYSIAPIIKKKEEKHTIVLVSTISPKESNKRLVPLLEKLTHKKVGREIGFCYSPEFIALGSVIDNIRNPDTILVGASDLQTGDLVESIRFSLCSNKPYITRTNYINAEIAKLSLNTYITTKISFANMIARLCEKIPGADVDIVTKAIGSDSRVGHKYLKGGLGYGGPCFPRDNLALLYAIKSIGLNFRLPLAVHAFNKEQIDSVFNVILKYKKNNKKVGILGLGYKPHTDVVDESQSILLIKKLIRHKFMVFAYDPMAINNAKKQVEDVHYVESYTKCIQSADIIIVATDSQEFRNISWSKLINKHKTIIDCWRIIQKNQVNSKFITYIPIGIYCA